MKTSHQLFDPNGNEINHFLLVPKHLARSEIVQVTVGLLITNKIMRESMYSKYGNQIAEIIDAYTTNNEFSYNELTNLNPGETQNISITYTANSNNSSGSYRIFSNDEDESEIICETNGNIIGANVGDNAPNFELNIIANGTGLFQLSDYIGQVVVIAFFAPN